MSRIHCFIMAILLATSASAQDKTVAFYYQREFISVTPEQHNQLDTVQDEYRQQIFRLEDELDADKRNVERSIEDIRRGIRDLELARDAKIESLFTVEQRRQFRAARLETLRKTVDRDADFLQRFAAVAKHIANADSVIVYEGLPRLDEAGIEREKRENETFQMDGFDFYAKPIALEQEIIDALQRHVADYRSFIPYGGPKFCGGYHPDLCLEWHTSGQVYRAFFCFGCHEGRFMGPDTKFMVDVDHNAYEVLYDLSKTFLRQGHLPAALEP